MSKKKLFTLIIIAIIALLLRIWHLDKPEGLWNDEYVSWFISSQRPFSHFCREIFNNCHMPIYYIYLKIWSFLFSDSDISLRFSSVLCSVASVFVMFFAGKEFKDEKTGFLAALLCTLSSFLIYFAQEVRIYSLLFLFSSYSLWAWIKCAKNFTKINFLNLLFANILIVFTHTIGIVFVAFNVLALLIYKRKEENLNFQKGLKLFFPYLFIMILISPFIYKLISSNTLSQFWSNFNFSKVYFVLSDYFSPLQVNVINTPKNILSVAFKNNSFNIGFIVFSLLPALISVGLIIRSLKDRIIKYYALSCASFFLVLILAAMIGKIVFITKYSIEIYPFLIVAISCSLLTLNKKIFVPLFSFLLLINSSYLIFAKHSAPKLTRPEGNFAPVAMIEQAGLNKDDMIVLMYYDRHFFEKYFDSTQYNILEITKYTYPYFLFSSTPELKNIIRDKNLEHYEFFKNNDTTYFEQAFKNEIYNKVPKHAKVAFVFLDSVAFYSLNNIQTFSEKEYKQTPFIFLAFSYLRNNIINVAQVNNMKLNLFLEAGQWCLLEFEKE